MKIKEYQQKFEELFNLLQAEHGTVASVVIKPSIRFEIPTDGISETIADCAITFSRNTD